MMEPKYEFKLPAEFETGALFSSVGYGPISRKIYLSLM